MVPVQVIGLTDIVDVEAGTHSLALKSDGTMWAWGRNQFGQHGVGNLQDHTTPVMISGITGVVEMACGHYNSVARKSDGSVWICGYGGGGQIGNGTAITSVMYAAQTTISDVVDIEAGEYHITARKGDGTVWCWGANNYGQLGDSTTLQSNMPVQVHDIQNAVTIFSGWSSSFALRPDGTLWGWGSNTYGGLGDSTGTERHEPVRSYTGCELWLPPGETPHHVTGYIYDDVNADCLMQQPEMKLPFIPVLVTPGNYYTSSNDTGYYSLGVFDSVSYTLKPLIPQHLSTVLSNPCPLDYQLYLDQGDPSDSGDFNFGMDAIACYQLRTEVVASRKRPCRKNQTTVYYFNEGLLAANNVELRVKFDTSNIPLSASLPYTFDPVDNSILFNLGTLDPFEQGAIAIFDSVPCNQSLLGLTICTEAYILPVNQCYIDSTTGPSWDNSSIKVRGSCVNDTVQFVIKNKGSGNMLQPSQYRLYFDNIQMLFGSFQLVAGDSLILKYASGGATLRLEADQHPDHPGNSHPRASVEACGTSGTGGFTTGMINQVPMDDDDLDIEIDCQRIVGSQDPNMKEVAPWGIGLNNVIVEDAMLDFTIYFQNTGSDTAFQVLITDTISQLLDISTLQSGAASHPYYISLSGQGIPVLSFTFNDINLPDSATNEPNSHGYVKYKIGLLPGVSQGSIIYNTANIYFDFNLPVITNTTFLTLGEYLVSEAEIDDEAEGTLEVFPNPTTENISLIISRGTVIKRVEVFSMNGVQYLELNNADASDHINIATENLPGGVYLVKCTTSTGRINYVKLIKLK
jgi:Regulator of chromosome condensation (RCC1) repeat/Secretion system C-terminal sorting domain